MISSGKLPTLKMDSNYTESKPGLAGNEKPQTRNIDERMQTNTGFELKNSSKIHYPDKLWN
jgi:hypothetical protein